MPRFAANLSMMFTEVPFLDRFEAAAKAGFTAVEFLFPYDHPAEAVGEAAARQRPDAGAVQPAAGQLGRRRKGLCRAAGPFCRSAAEPAHRAALCAGDRRQAAASDGGYCRPQAISKAVEAFYKSVAWAAEFFAPHGLDVVIEPINPRNVPGYFLNDFVFARDLINELKIPNLKLQFDIYHCQIIHGDVTMRLREMMPIIGHIQIASIPSRNEPDGEELNYPFLFAELDRLGYGGFVGCEYNPRGKTTDGLGWFKPYAGVKP